MSQDPASNASFSPYLGDPPALSKYQRRRMAETVVMDCHGLSTAEKTWGLVSHTSTS